MRRNRNSFRPPRPPRNEAFGAASAILAALILNFLAAFLAPAAAHESRPLFIQLTEAPDGKIEIIWAAPAAIEAGNAPMVHLNPPCEAVRREGGDPRRQRAVYACSIADVTVSVDWPIYNPSISTLIRVVFSNGETRTAILDPSQREWRPPAPESFEGVSRSYFKIGIEHIVGGIDHLLFLAGLLIIAGAPRRALVTVTGFTLAHSLTLALVSLGVLNVSIPATEAVIALSIVFLACEIARGDRSTLAMRRPVLVASAFGLVHGAGFAAALGEIGLPKTETLAALLFFNLGVETGQIAIVAAVFFLLHLLKIAAAPFHAVTRLGLLGRIGGYALGVISAYWFIERIAVLFAA